MAQLVPPIPYKSPMLTEDGFLTEPWSKWFRDMFNRIGGVDALTNKELAVLQSQDLSGLTATVTTLQALVTTLQTNVNGLNQGPKL